ncbi:MAG TPA: phosphoglucosamine mutase, partial [Acidimicrobiales bacterium]|nr:phosphoglucosamine mutase [Acidimicrobiales bacterium]
MLAFGTDGVRGVGNVELTPELVVALGRAVARVLGVERFLLARDTRRSGPLLQAALAAGLSAEGVAVADLGVLPTPGLAYTSASRAVPAAMISASHNPFPDNGIKVFSPEGTKLADHLETAIEAAWDQVLAEGATPGAGRPPRSGAAVGPVEADGEAAASYLDHLRGSLHGRSLAGLSVVLDCAHGAASALAPGLVASLGAQVETLGADPDGTNINDGCGSTHPEALQAAVRSSGADVGLAFDGDADRCLAVDHHGRVVDGDHLLALFALDLAQRGELDGGGVAVTVMTNLGFRLAMEVAGIEVVVTPVGDRHVAEAMADGGLALGGEQSGHIIFSRLATTGDGMLTGLQLLDLVCRRGLPLAELAAQAMTRLPQHLVNVTLAPGGIARLPGAAGVWEEVAAVEAELGDKGRVLLRPSGTEPLIRVMAEAQGLEEAIAAVDRLCTVVRRELGAPEP